MKLRGCHSHGTASAGYPEPRRNLGDEAAAPGVVSRGPHTRGLSVATSLEGVGPVLVGDTAPGEMTPSGWEGLAVKALQGWAQP